MRMRQIIAKDMKEAMLLARETLGEDAVLLSSEKRNKSIVVTFAIEEEAFEEAFFAADGRLSNDNQHQTAPHYLEEEEARPFFSQKNANIHLNEKAMAGSVHGLAPHQPIRQPQKTPESLKVPRSSYPAYELLLSILNHHRMPEDLYINITALLDKIDMPRQLSYDSCEQILTKALTPNVTVKPLHHTLNEKNPRALMAIGPHGAGKSTLIAKLATSAHMAGVPVMLFSADTEQMAGTAMLETLKDVLKCELFIVESRSDLKKLVKSQLGKALLLIDSPGVNIYNFQEMKALGELASLADIEPILTCPAGLDADEATELASVFSFLNIERFALTKVDCVRHFAACYALLQHNYALALITSNAKPSSPIQPASHQLLAELSCAYIRERMAA